MVSYSRGVDGARREQTVRLLNGWTAHKKKDGMGSSVQPTTLAPIRFTSSRVLPASLWLVSVIAMTLSFVSDLSGAHIVAALASLLFIVMLIAHLIHIVPHATDLPDLAPLVAPRLGFWA